MKKSTSIYNTANIKVNYKIHSSPLLLLIKESQHQSTNLQVNQFL